MKRKFFGATYMLADCGGKKREIGVIRSEPGVWIVALVETGGKIKRVYSEHFPRMSNPSALQESLRRMAVDYGMERGPSGKGGAA